MMTNCNFYRAKIRKDFYYMSCKIVIIQDKYKVYRQKSTIFAA